MDLKLYRLGSGNLLVLPGGSYFNSEPWDSVVNRVGLHAALLDDLKSGRFKPSDEPGIPGDVQVPAGSQEIWAAGVTYFRSREARMEESESSGASRFYDLVYTAERPELFFKGAAWRAVAHRSKVRIRRDSMWNVPEPELTLFVSSAGTIEAYTIGNDMSSRSIEGENPLYLPQAKIYDGSAALGPCLLIPEKPLGPETKISMSIQRSGTEVFAGQAELRQMKRGLDELAGWLTRELSFPHGVLLMTGTCVVPGDDFTLQSGDVIRMSIERIGSLENTVA